MQCFLATTEAGDQLYVCWRISAYSCDLGMSL